MAASTSPSCNTLGGFVSTALSVVDERIQTGTVEPELTAPWPKPKSERTPQNSCNSRCVAVLDMKFNEIQRFSLFHSFRVFFPSFPVFLKDLLLSSLEPPQVTLLELLGLISVRHAGQLMQPALPAVAADLRDERQLQRLGGQVSPWSLGGRWMDHPLLWIFYDVL